MRVTHIFMGGLAIHEGDAVVDLRSNMGNFSYLALAHGPHVRVVAVEPSSSLDEAMRRLLALNPGFLGRVKLIWTFLGAPDENF